MAARAILTRMVITLLLAGLLAGTPAVARRSQSPSPFGSDRLALGAGGYFDTDNLISNGAHAGALDLRRRVCAMARTRVSPDQNYSIAAVLRSLSSSTCAATTCSCTCSSRRCSGCRARGSKYIAQPSAAILPTSTPGAPHPSIGSSPTSTARPRFRPASNAPAWTTPSCAWECRSRRRTARRSIVPPQVRRRRPVAQV